MTTRQETRNRQGGSAGFGIWVDLRTGGPSRKAILYNDPEPVKTPKTSG